jgi:hypothetical protein
MLAFTPVTSDDLQERGEELEILLMIVLEI